MPREESRFSPPPGMGCREYAGGFADMVGGYVSDVGGGLCSFCQYSSGDQFVCFFPSLSWRRNVADNGAGCKLQRILRSQMAKLCKFQNHTISFP